jgi:hypothetical protein
MKESLEVGGAICNINIYITSENENINENDYVMTRDGELIQVDYLLSPYVQNSNKVILTTNTTLIEDGVQAIDDEFLEWFVKNHTCDFVEVELECFYQGKCVKERCLTYCCDEKQYKIIIPQEEPKQDCTCGVCNECEEQETIQILNEAKENALKQSTLEEAAKEFYPPTTTDLICSPKLVRDAFIAGAKFQAERMYAEADNIMRFLDTEVELKLSDTKTIERIKWYFETYFEQFKKK